MGIRLDPEEVYAVNQKKTGVIRKNGCIINTGSIFNVILLFLSSFSISHKFCSLFVFLNWKFEIETTQLLKSEKERSKKT